MFTLTIFWVISVTTAEKRKSDAGLPPAPKRGRSRSKSPAVGPKTQGNEFKRSPVVMEPLKSKVNEFFCTSLFQENKQRHCEPFLMY